MAYEVLTIGDLASGLGGQAWPSIPPGWVPSGTPGIKLPSGAILPPPVPGPPAPPVGGSQTVDAMSVGLVAFGGVALGALGFWAWATYGKRRR